MFTWTKRWLPDRRVGVTACCVLVGAEKYVTRDDYFPGSTIVMGVKAILMTSKAIYLLHVN